MKLAKSNKEWREVVPAHITPLLTELEKHAVEALDNGTPFHTVRLHAAHLAKSGRVLGWAISVAVQVGWEFQSTTLDKDGTMWLLYKSPYIFP